LDDGDVLAGTTLGGARSRCRAFPCRDGPRRGAGRLLVTSYTTDRFNAFGGRGTSTYVAGTDGGVSAKGFADRVVNYRNTIFKIFEVGIQRRFRGTDWRIADPGNGACLLSSE
jgi:hypothetical protein